MSSSWSTVLELGLWSGCCGALIMTWWASSATERTPRNHRRGHIGKVEQVVLFDPDSISEAIAVVKERNPFHASEAAAAGLSSASSAVAVPALKPPRPLLLLRGVIGGPPWQVVLEGVPGRTGSVALRSGEVIGGIRLRAVRRDTVIVEGVDTTWRLTLRRQ